MCNTCIDLSYIAGSAMDTDNRYMVFNVGGVRFQTSTETLRKGNLETLCNEEFLAKYRDSKRDEYFFDRDPNMFLAILNYLRTGELHLPAFMCGPAAKIELDFWGVEELSIQPCCWINFNEGNSTKDALIRLEKDRKKNMYPKHEKSKKKQDMKEANHETSSDVKKEYNLDEAAVNKSLESGSNVNCLAKAKARLTKTRTVNWREKGWRVMNRTQSSRGAQVYGYTSLLLVVMSIFSFMAETTKPFEYFESGHVTVTANQSNTSVSVNGSTNMTQTALNAVTDLHLIRSKHPVLKIIDMICLVYFIIEYLVRLTFSPKKLKHATSLLAVIDLLAILPDLVETIVYYATPELQESLNAAGFITIIRIVRILRIFRLVRHSAGLWILIYTLRASFNELMLLVWFVIIGIFVFSSLIYFVDDRSKYTSIPDGFWWAIITMTTVGYGDYYPVTIPGKIVGSFCAMAGVLMIGFSVPSLVNNFRLYYRHVQLAMHMDKLKRVSFKAREHAQQLKRVSLKAREHAQHRDNIMESCQTEEELRKLMYKR